MEYTDMDIMLKYQFAMEREKSTYYGDPIIYQDGKTLETFPEHGDKVNGKTPVLVMGNVVYLRYGDNYLMLEQKKSDRVVDTFVGLGGKVRPIFGNAVQASEKNNIYDVLHTYEAGRLDLAEKMKVAAAREVMEETSTYRKEPDGTYTHEIVREGLSINPNGLKNIGVSRIRIILPQKTECWLIHNYIYDLSDKEYDFIEQSVSKENREGSLQWLTKEEALPRMSNSDRIVLEKTDTVTPIAVSEIRDNIGNHNITRVVLDPSYCAHCGTIIDGTIYSNDEECSKLLNNNQDSTGCAKR